MKIYAPRREFIAPRRKQGGYVGFFSAGAMGSGTPSDPDPYFDQVVAGLHFNGEDGSTDFVDVKSSTWTPAYGARIEEDSYRFGGTSGWFKNVGGVGTDVSSRISTPDHANFRFGTGDFTVDGWFNIDYPIIGFGAFLRKGQNTSGGLQIAITPTTITVRADGVTDTTATFGSLTVGTWHFIEVSRTSGVLYFFLDGVLIHSASRSFDHTDTEALYLGSVAGDPRYAYNGYADDVRITKGVGRHTASYSLPTSPFPDF